MSRWNEFDNWTVDAKVTVAAQPARTAVTSTRMATGDDLTSVLTLGGLLNLPP